MLHVKFCPKNWHYCNWKSLAACVNNHSSACWSATTDDHGRITIKIPSNIPAFFVAAQSYYTCQINFCKHQR